MLLLPMKTIPLGSNGHEGIALVDDVDFEFVSQWAWHLSGKYAARQVRIKGTKRKRTLYLHRLITGCPEGLEVDHIDGDKTNCQRYNLRTATQGQNATNRRKRAGTSSQFKGVSWYTKIGKWRAYYNRNGRTLYLGNFDDEEAAARAYDAAARVHYGEYARLNFPD